MRPISVYIVGIILLFIGCSSSPEPNNFLNIKFGTEYNKVKKYMLSKGYMLYLEEPNQNKISFTGTYEGFKSDMILLEMDEEHLFKEGWINVKEDKEKFASFMKDKFTKLYKQFSEYQNHEKWEMWKWKFDSYTIVVGLGNELAYYRVIKNK